MAALRLEDLDYIDNRKKGGAFWIIGETEISDYVQELKQKLGYSFAFKAWGEHATAGEDAWRTI
mgnify:CR=1 FL=1